MNVTSVDVEQGCSQTKLRIVGNNNKLFYFHTLDFTKLPRKSLSLFDGTVALIYIKYKDLETSLKN